MGNEEDDGNKRPKRSLEEWDEIQAKRRDAMSEQQQALSDMRSDSSSQNPAQMTMAERIELARQRARQQAGVQGQGDQQAEALRQARARAEQQAKQQREQAQRQQAQRERAARQQSDQRKREQIKQQRRRQQAEQEAQAQRQRRAKQQRRTQSTKRATTGSKRESVVADSMQRIHKGHEHTGPQVSRRKKKGPAGTTHRGLGLMDRNALRKAFIMKELLDKPVALRDPQADLPS
jgi:hypothetical protein